MPLESATFLQDLVATNPAHTDGLSQADSHMRLIKQVLQNTFPGFDAALTRSPGGIILPTDGTSSAPGYSFASELTLGLYRSAAGVISVAGGRLSATGVVSPGALRLFLAPPPSFGNGGTGGPFEWLELDGSTVLISMYPALCAALGHAGNFTLPAVTDTGRFLRSRTSTNAVGNSQSNAVVSHTHSLTTASTGSENANHAHNIPAMTTGGMSANDPHTHGATGQGVVGSGGSQLLEGSGLPFNVNTVTVAATSIAHTHNTPSTTSGTESAPHQHALVGNTDATGSAETRPENLAVIICIKT